MYSPLRPGRHQQEDKASLAVKKQADHYTQEAEGKNKKWDKAMQPQCLPELQTSSSIVPTSQRFYHLPKQHLPGTLRWNIETYGWGAEFQFQITIFNITPAWQPHAGLNKLFATHSVSHVIFFHCFSMYYLVSYWEKHVQATVQKWAEERHPNRL